MVGRAGRRGFDAIGYTIFFEANPDRVRELLYAPMQSITTATPINPETVLKLLILLEHNASELQRRSAHTALERLMQAPVGVRDSVQAAALNRSILHFSLLFLRHQLLVDRRGGPIGFSGLVSHVPEHSVAANTLAALIRFGALNRLAAPFRVAPSTRALLNQPQKQVEEARKEAKKELMQLLAYLFFHVRAQDKHRLAPLHPEIKVPRSLPLPVFQSLSLSGTLRPIS